MSEEPLTDEELLRLQYDEISAGLARRTVEEIKALRSSNQKLREALRAIRDHEYPVSPSLLEIADAALAQDADRGGCSPSAEGSAPLDPSRSTSGGGGKDERSPASGGPSKPDAPSRPRIADEGEMLVTGARQDRERIPANPAAPYAPISVRASVRGLVEVSFSHSQSVCLKPGQARALAGDLGRAAEEATPPEDRNRLGFGGADGRPSSEAANSAVARCSKCNYPLSENVHQKCDGPSTTEKKGTGAFTVNPGAAKCKPTDWSDNREDVHPKPRFWCEIHGVFDTDYCPAWDYNPNKRAHLDDPESLARFFHDTYERLAPGFGYKTRKESAVPWEKVPEKNRKLIIAVAAEVQKRFGERGQR